LLAYSVDDETAIVASTRLYGPFSQFRATWKISPNCDLQDMVDLPTVYDCEVYDSFFTPGSYITTTIDILGDAGRA
jgi:ribosome-associated toxin RatA of RatAB toxin-antitoxin module